MTLGEGKRMLWRELPVDNPRQEAAWMLCALMDMDAAGLLTREGERIARNKLDLLHDWVRRRKAGEPLQYILGEWPFMGLALKVRKGVLIPREESEILVRLAANELKDCPDGRALDLCTGSGAIGIALAKSAPHVQVDVLDISEDACALAKENGEANGVEIRVYRKDLLSEAFWQEKCFQSAYHVLTANPPYISAEEYAALDSSVGDYEPSLALLGGEDGLLFYRIFAQRAADLLLPGGTLIMEIGHLQGPAVVSLFENENWMEPALVQDINGKDRAVIVRTP